MLSAAGAIPRVMNLSADREREELPSPKEVWNFFDDKERIARAHRLFHECFHMGCHKVFKTIVELRNHYMSEHNVNECFYHGCNERFNNANEWRLHFMQQHVFREPRKTTRNLRSRYR